MHNIETGQAVIKHEPPTDSSLSITNPKIRAEINFRLGNELRDIILSPVVGIQRVRKVLNRYGLDVPALYDLESDGDEVVLEMDQYGKVRDAYDMPQLNQNPLDSSHGMYYLYLIYVLLDEGTYDFHAEITDEEGIEDIMLDDNESEEDV
ncbi:hypothetical protein M0R04_05115 [Candidatus Dojkabacteria bacterium]|jgi:hypothetical protein|nr:hypothetical protein [Candidatus Dojkabacteria bacterium]